MNRIILIGNGFDLAHGLKTSYKHFIDNFWEKQVNKILSSVFNGNELITNSYEDNVVKAYATNSDWKMIKNTFDPKYKGYNLFQTFCHMPVTFIGDDETYNTEFYCKYNFLKRISDKQHFDKWVDIECEYYKALLECLDSNNSDEAVSQLNNEFNSIQILLQEYLSEEYKDLPSLNLYIRSHIFSSIDEKDIILFLNFNYTRTLCSYTYATRNTQTIYIHGELDKSMNNPIIFGYGDEIDDNYIKLEKNNNRGFLEYIKSIKYSLTENYQRMLSFLEAGDFEVYIMGLSCGLSDRTLLNIIFEHNNCKSVKIFFKQIDSINDSYLDTYINVSRNFNNKNLLRKKVLPRPKCVSLTPLNK